MKYTINYGLGVAKLYTPSKNWENRFYDLANQCFGIRKNILQVELVAKEDTRPKLRYEGEYERLEHDGDLIVWDKEGNKIKSEWDD